MTSGSVNRSGRHSRVEVSDSTDAALVGSDVVVTIWSIVEIAYRQSPRPACATASPSRHAPARLAGTPRLGSARTNSTGARGNPYW
jgi:hypothetical protein